MRLILQGLSRFAVERVWLLVRVRKLFCDFDAHELSKRLYAELFHDLGAMNLNCSLADAEVLRDGLVHLAFRNELEDLAFTLG